MESELLLHLAELMAGIYDAQQAACTRWGFSSRSRDSMSFTLILDVIYRKRSGTTSWHLDASLL